MQIQVQQITLQGSQASGPHSSTQPQAPHDNTDIHCRWAYVHSKFNKYVFDIIRQSGTLWNKSSTHQKVLQ